MLISNTVIPDKTPPCFGHLFFQSLGVGLPARALQVRRGVGVKLIKDFFATNLFPSTSSNQVDHSLILGKNIIPLHPPLKLIGRLCPFTRLSVSVISVFYARRAGRLFSSQRAVMHCILFYILYFNASIIIYFTS